MGAEEACGEGGGRGGGDDGSVYAVPTTIVPVSWLLCFMYMPVFVMVKPRHSCAQAMVAAVVRVGEGWRVERLQRFTDDAMPAPNNALGGRPRNLSKQRRQPWRRRWRRADTPAPR